MCLRVLRALVPYVLSCLTSYRAIRASCLCALVTQVPRAIRALVLDVPCALRALVPYVPRALCALVPHVLCNLRAFVSHESYVLLQLTCFLLCGSSCCLFLVPYMLFCTSSPICFRWFKCNIIICMSCLVAFMSCSSCAFGGWAIWVFYSLD